MPADLISDVTGEDVKDILWMWRKHKYAFLTPVIEGEDGRRPRIKRSIGYMAIYTKDRKYAFVFTNSTYLKYRQYAVEIIIDEAEIKRK
ncbi:MAG: hypothetical protein DRP74_08850 [Candidatus Omnitrophota bacterium]|nr:MAG: hypothetical protein DRP74_08850 [Candidatus Omnitrophota bacterium]